MKYTVLNPHLVFSVKDGDKGRKEYTLNKGDMVDLPENDITVRALVARKQIKAVDEPIAQTPAKVEEAVDASAEKPGSKKGK